jgi:hypothetical protein
LADATLDQDLYTAEPTMTENGAWIPTPEVR